MDSAPDKPQEKRSRSEEVSSDSSESSDDDSSSSDSSGSAEQAKRKKRKKSENKQKHKKSEKKKKRKKHKKKSHKSKKSHKEKKNAGAIKTGYGSRGIITAVDMYNKQAEFFAYMEEVKGISFESLSNGMMKAEFRGFMEDYNTATMPDDKYYNMERHERLSAQKTAQKQSKLLRKQMKVAAREGNARFDETQLSAKRQQQFAEERLQKERAELGGIALEAREREADAMARILGLVNKSALMNS